MNQTIERIAEIEVFIRRGEYDCSIIVEPDGIRFERYLSSKDERETLQIVENSIKANGKKRDTIWRVEPPSRDSGYAMFYVKI